MRLVEVADRGAHPQRIATGFAGGLPHDVFLVSLRRRVSTKKLTVRLRR